jgi:hypothetical protein
VLLEKDPESFGWLPPKCRPGITVPLYLSSTTWSIVANARQHAVNIHLDPILAEHSVYNTC